MKIVVIDGQGGRMGSTFIDKWIKSGGDPKELIAVGTNAMATSAMMKAGAVKAATVSYTHLTLPTIRLV